MNKYKRIKKSKYMNINAKDSYGEQKLKWFNSMLRGQLLV